MGRGKGCASDGVVVVCMQVSEGGDRVGRVCAGCFTRVCGSRPPITDRSTCSKGIDKAPSIGMMTMKKKARGGKKKWRWRGAVPARLNTGCAPDRIEDADPACSTFQQKVNANVAYVCVCVCSRAGTGPPELRTQAASHVGCITSRRSALPAFR